MTKFLSGHGGQTKDLDGDEEDGYDEVIYPVDFRTAGYIVDDEMHRIMYAYPGRSHAKVYADGLIGSRVSNRAFA
jgi:hypothetical protein